MGAGCALREGLPLVGSLETREKNTIPNKPPRRLFRRSGCALPASNHLLNFAYFLCLRRARRAGVMRKPVLQSPAGQRAARTPLRPLQPAELPARTVVVTFQPGKPRGRPFRAGSDERRCQSSPSASPPAPQAEPEMTAAQALRALGGAPESARTLTNAERYAKVDGRLLLAIQNLEESALAQGLSHLSQFVDLASMYTKSKCPNSEKL